MSLSSKHFTTGDGALACQRALVAPAAHITKGLRGPQVRKIQAALAAITGASFDDYDVAHQYYGQSTADAVLDYKTNHDPPIVNTNYQKVPDNIVGQMTIAALDRDMKALEGGDDPPAPPKPAPPPPPKPPAPPQPKPPAPPPAPPPPKPTPPAPPPAPPPGPKLDRALFVPHKQPQGFDPSPGPVKVKGEGFQAVPRDDVRVVRLIGAGNSDASGLKVEVVDTTGRPAAHVASVRELSPPTAPDRTFQITGHTVGGARLEATDLDGSLAAAVQIAVLPPKQLTVRFHNVSDSAGHAATRVQGSDIFDWINTANKIWSQAAISMSSSGFSSLAIKGDAGRAVNTSGEVLIIAEAAKAGFGGLGLSERRVFFVWDLQDNEGTVTGGDTPLFGPVIFIDEDQSAKSTTLAHEIGHSLKLEHTQGDHDNLMIDVSNPGERPRLLTKAQILLANPPR